MSITMIDEVYQLTKHLYQQIQKTRSKTIASTEFKGNANVLYEDWKRKLEPQLKNLQVDSQTLSHLDKLFEQVDIYSKNRVSEIYDVKKTLEDLNKTLLAISARTIDEKENHNLIKSAQFLGLDQNWFSATCALQLQEVSIKITAEKLGISLEKAEVERILKKRIQTENGNVSYSDQYQAFSIEVKRMQGIEMPILTTELRRMRVNVLHKGYNPQPEEQEGIEGFTVGLLKKLENLCQQKTISAQ